MKKNYFLHFSAFFCIFLLIISCDNKDENASTNYQTYNERYYYEGNYYEFEFRKYDDGVIEFMGDTTSTDFDIISTALQNSNSKLVYSDDLTVYLFDNNEQKEQYLDSKGENELCELKNATAYSSICIFLYSYANFGIELFDAANPNDYAIPVYSSLDKSYGFGSLYNIDGRNFNDTFSSLHALNYSGKRLKIILFEDTGFGGCTWTIIVRPSSENNTGDSNSDYEFIRTYTYQLADFKNMTMKTTGRLWWKKTITWDDNVSSLKWTFEGNSGGSIY